MDAGQQDRAALDRAQLRTKTREELESLILKADQIIQKKERGRFTVCSFVSFLLWSCHASVFGNLGPECALIGLFVLLLDLATVAKVGQSLLQHNNELRNRKHEVSMHSTPPLVLSPSIASLLARGGQSQSRFKRRVRGDQGWETEEDELQTEKRFTPQNMQTYSSTSISPVYRKRSHHRGYSSTRSSVSSISAADVQIIHHRASPSSDLNTLNAELLNQVEELEVEASRANAQSKRKMKRLERELADLRQDHEKIMQKNQSLEDKLQRRIMAELRARRSSSETVSELGTEDRTPYGWSSSGESLSSPDRIMKTSTDSDSPNSTVLESQTPTRPSYHARDSTLTISESSSRPSLNRQISDNDNPLTVQLLARIADLEEANQTLSQEREQMSVELVRAVEESHELQKSHDEMEEVFRLQEEQLRHQKSLNEWREVSDLLDIPLWRLK